MTIATPQTFEPDGRAIRVVDEGEGPVVVLLPGRGLDIASLGTLAHVLEEEGFRIVRIGSRRPSADAVTMHDLAQDVVDVLDDLGLGVVWVGGHAFGGALARTVALDHPERVEGVLLLGVENGEPATDEASAALETVFSDAADAEALAAIRVLAGGVVDPAFLRRIFTGAQDASIEPMQSAALAATPVEEWASLPEAGPVLVIQGSDDRVTPFANGERLQAAAPSRVSMARIEGGGHLFVLTHPGEIGAEIEDYLGWD